jgi:phenylpyruvate tautomerase PptA (4-oxalocrotonate tautomerase family)
VNWEAKVADGTIKKLKADVLKVYLKHHGEKTAGAKDALVAKVTQLVANKMGGSEPAAGGSAAPAAAAAAENDDGDDEEEEEE